MKFKSSQKNWTGPKASSVKFSLPKAGELTLCELKSTQAAANGGALVPIG